MVWLRGPFIGCLMEKANSQKPLPAVAYEAVCSTGVSRAALRSVDRRLMGWPPQAAGCSSGGARVPLLLPKPSINTVSCQYCLGKGQFLVQAAGCEAPPSGSGSAANRKHFRIVVPRCQLWCVLLQAAGR